MDYSWSCVVLSIVLLTANVVTSASVDVQPSPVGTVTEGAVLWLTCTYDLDGGTLGQLQWKDKNNGNAATATPTATPPCSTPSETYSVDCNLASNEVRLGILTPVHGDTYSCTVYLSDVTLIGNVSTQLSVVVPVPSVTFTPPVSDTVTVTHGGSQTYTCVTGSCRPPARIDWYKDGVNVTTQAGNVSSDGDKFVTTSSLTLTGVRGDSPVTVQCRASNVDGMNAVQSGTKLFAVQWAPDGPPVISGYSQTTILYPNNRLSLQCRQSGGNPLPTLTWSGVCGGVTATNTDTEAVSDVTITVTKDYNRATCVCVSTHPVPQTQDRTQVTFTVHFGPDNVSITGNRVIVADGTNNLTLTCTTQEYNRHVHITWYNGTTRISNTAVVTNTSGTNGGSVSTQVLQLTPNRYQDGSVVRCVVQNEDVMLGQRTASVTLNHNYPPSTPVSVSVNPVTEGRDNSIAVLTCQVTGGKPKPSLQWTCPAGVSTTAPTTGSQGDRHTSVITVTLTRQANGQRCSCTGSQTDTTWTGSDHSPVFAVRFGPGSVNIIGNKIIVADGTNTLTLTCITQEYNRHVHITWYNGTTRISNTAVVTNTSGTNGGSVSTHVLQFTPDRYQDSNMVRCVVQNEDITLAERAMSVTLDIYYQPYVTLTPTPGVKVTEGGDLEIRCDVDSNPASSITWSRVGGQLPFNADVTSGVLRIPSTHRADNGTYRCTAQNSVGTAQDSLVIDVHKQCPPSPPLYLLQKHVTGSSITIQWIPGSDEGQTPTFVIGYRSDVTTEYTDLDVMPDSRESVMSYMIEGLTPDTLYYIRVYAQNDIGMSDILFLNCSTTNVCLCQGESHDELYSTRTALISVTSILILVVVMMVIVFVIVRMRKTPACFKRDSANAKQAYKTSQHSEPGQNLSNEGNQLSTYEDLNLVNVSPPSVYEDIRGRDQSTGDNSDGNTYEMLGRKAAPNVYEELSKIK